MRVLSLALSALLLGVTVGQTCDNGLPGVSNGDVCCKLECGDECGGKGCSDRGNGLDGDDCCTSNIIRNNEMCADTGSAPCIGPAPTGTTGTCIAGVPGILVKEVCCPNSCGSCAGKGCGGRDGGDDFTGSQACCGGGVRSLDRVCSATVGAPCVVEDGVGCGGRDGGDDFTGSEACCGSGVRSLDRVCSATVGAPCVVSDVNSCLDLTSSVRCTREGDAIELNLSNCGITDADVASGALEACFAEFGEANILFLELDLNALTTLPAGILDGLDNLIRLDLEANALKTLPAGIFDEVETMQVLFLDTNELIELPDGVFDKLVALTTLNLDDNELTVIPAGIFDALGALEDLYLDGNQLTTLPAGIFDNLGVLRVLGIDNNALTSLPTGIFDNLVALEFLLVDDNPDLECLPTVPASVTNLQVDDSVAECGAGCSGRESGDDNFTGSEACCESGVKTLDRTCGADVGAPCVVEDDA
eukprot:g6758.t1